MNVVQTALPGVLLLEPVVRSDERGHFCETWNDARYAAAGVASPFVQDNLSFSNGGVLRGLHLQWPCAQGKLIHVPFGAVYDVAVDVRVGSPTFGQWVGAVLDATTMRQMWIPPGFAHGFAVQSAGAVVQYKVTAPYEPSDEITIAWNDPRIGIEWPIAEPKLSPRDAAAPQLDDVMTRLPRWSRASGLASDHP